MCNIDSPGEERSQRSEETGAAQEDVQHYETNARGTARE